MSNCISATSLFMLKVCETLSNCNSSNLLQVYLCSKFVKQHKCVQPNKHTINTKTQSLSQKEVHTSQLHIAQVHTTQQTHKNTNIVPERSAYFIVHTKAIVALAQKQTFPIENRPFSNRKSGFFRWKIGLFPLKNQKKGLMLAEKYFKDRWILTDNKNLS